MHSSRVWYGQVRFWRTCLGAAHRLARLERVTVLFAKLLIAASMASTEAPVLMSWDQDLAFDYDRENYQRTLTDILKAYPCPEEP